MMVQESPRVDIAELRGVGPKSAALFRELGVETAQALLDYLPFRYDDLRFPTPALRLGETGGEENAVGLVVAVKERRVRGLEIVELQLHDDAGALFTAKWIGRNRYVVGRFREGMRLMVRGRVERIFSGPVVNVVHYEALGENEPYRGELVPVYRASKELATRKIAMVVKKNLSDLLAPRSTGSVAAGACSPTGIRLDPGSLSLHACTADAPRIRTRARALRLCGVSRIGDGRTTAARRARERSRCAGVRGSGESIGTNRSFAAFFIDRGAAPGDRGDLERFAARRSDESALARRRRQWKDAGCGGRRSGRGRKWFAIGLDGPNRTARVAARK